MGPWSAKREHRRPTTGWLVIGRRLNRDNNSTFGRATNTLGEEAWPQIDAWFDMSGDAGLEMRNEEEIPGPRAGSPDWRQTIDLAATSRELTPQKFPFPPKFSQPRGKEGWRANPYTLQWKQAYKIWCFIHPSFADWELLFCCANLLKCCSYVFSIISHGLCGVSQSVNST
jgi:hypothetical protein